MAHDTETSSGSWERGLVEQLAFAAIAEQRRARRWGIFFKLLLALYLLAIFIMAVYPKLGSDWPISESGPGHSAVIHINGVIAQNEKANADAIIDSLHAAVKDPNTKGIILAINSPGGSPVHSDWIYRAIRAIKQKHPDLPLVSVVGDICASGGYYIASASDRIYVNPASIIGSIGVVMNSFGFVDTLAKLGVERRVLTAGEHKALMDPFSPTDTFETEHMQRMLGQVHQQFIDAVREGRGKRLKETPDLFTGLVWTGTEGVALGLADDYGNIRDVAENVIGAKKRIDFSPKQDLFERLSGKIGTTFAGHLRAWLGDLTWR
ncbi:MAG: signal peptide peptidase SppA [Methylococcales bacterium]|nr:signal peptide peptidase SppA [Methylococcales bacterium]